MKMYLFLLKSLVVNRKIQNHHFQCQVFALMINLSLLRSCVRDFLLLKIKKHPSQYIDSTRIIQVVLLFSLLGISVYYYLPIKERIRFEIIA